MFLKNDLSKQYLKRLDKDVFLLDDYYMNNNYGLENIIVEKHQEKNNRRKLSDYGYLIGYDKIFKKMMNFYPLLDEFRTLNTDTIEFAEACLLVINQMDEMLYDELRFVQRDLENVVLSLLESNKDDDRLLELIASSLYKEYINPKFYSALINKSDKTELYNTLFNHLVENTVYVR